MSGTARTGTSSADPATLRAYVRVSRDMDHELLLFARGRLRTAIADFRTTCPDAARSLPELDRHLEELANRGLRLSDMVERVSLIDLDDLENGHLGRWLGHMTPGLLLGAVTGGSGFLVRVARIAHHFAVEAEAMRATARHLAWELDQRGARALAKQLGRETTDELLRWSISSPPSGPPARSSGRSSARSILPFHASNTGCTNVPGAAASSNRQLS